MPEKLNDYLRTVGEQIRWTRARAPLTTELRTHLLEQYDTCLAQGMEEAAAETEALRQMGDPIGVGQELDRVHRPRPQWGLLCLTGALVLAGSILRVLLTANSGLPSLSGSYLGRNLAAVFIGFAVMLGAYFLDYGLLGRYAKRIYGATILAGLLSLIFSREVMGVSYCTRYIVLLFPIAYALWVYSLREKGWRGLLLAIMGGVPLAVIACLTPYILGLLILLLSGCAVLLVSAWKDWFGIRRKPGFALVLTTSLAGAGVMGWYFRRTFYHRLMLAFHPELDPLGRGYQGHVLREALTGSRLWGEGILSGSRTGYDYWHVVPGADTDCFLTTVIYHLGWLPFLLLCGALLVLLLWALVKCLRQKNALGRLLSVAILLTLGLQFLASVFLNLGFVFISATCPFLIGNLHTVLDMGLMGLLLSVFRQEQLPGPTQAPSAPSVSSRIRLPRYTISVSIKRGE